MDEEKIEMDSQQNNEQDNQTSDAAGDQNVDESDAAVESALMRLMGEQDATIYPADRGDEQQTETATETNEEEQVQIVEKSYENDAHILPVEPVVEPVAAPEPEPETEPAAETQVEAIQQVNPKNEQTQAATVSTHYEVVDVGDQQMHIVHQLTTGDMLISALIACNILVMLISRLIRKGW